MMPKRINLVPRLVLMTIAYFFKPKATRDRLPNRPVYYGRQGLIGISNDLSVQTVIARYRRGWFPICHVGSMKWWCPEERAVISPTDIRIDKGVRRLLRQNKFLVTFDDDFAGVMEACAAPRPGKTPLTWITPQIMHAFWVLHEAGYAHSVEVWDEDCHLVGGLYGLAIGGVFFAESRFARMKNTSKLAVAVLHHHLAHWGFGVRDAKWMSPQLASLGFNAVNRAKFNDMLKTYAWRPSRVGRWEIEETVATAAVVPDQTDK
jgi:leucyl/phenylalanyl-tRNA--protein transferase